MKKMKQILVLFLVCASATSIHGLLRTGTRRLPTTGASLARLTPQQKLYTIKVPTPLKIAPARSWFTNTSRTIADRITALKSQILNWYRGTTPVPGVSQQKLALPESQKELVVSVESVTQPEELKTLEVVAVKSVSPVVGVPQEGTTQAQIESEEILNKLRGKNPWDYTKRGRDPEVILKSNLAQHINQFLNKNDVSAIREVFFYLLTNSDGILILKEAAKKNKKFIAKIRPLIEQNKTLKLHQLSYLLNGQDFLKIVLNINKKYEQTPSYRHLESHYEELEPWDYKYFIKTGSNTTLLDIMRNIDFRRMIQDVMRKENDFINNGYEVFYHGRHWKYEFLSDVYGMLYSYKSGESLKDFIFMQIDDPVIGKIQDKFFESEQKTRENILEKGNYSSLSIGSSMGEGSRVLYLSKFAFGNLKELGSNPMFYVLNNKNMADVKISVREIFGMFGYSDIYDQFKNELYNLEKEHQKLTEYGELLQIAVPKNNLDKCINYVELGGSGKKESLDTPEFGSIEDIKKIVEHTNEYSEDSAEFNLIMTRDAFGGLNPKSGIKVRSCNIAHSEKMAAFKEKEKQLFDKIREACKEKNKKEKLAAAERE